MTPVDNEGIAARAVSDSSCKICGSGRLDIFAHTARCLDCGVLLYYPYPKSDGALVSDGEGKQWPVEHMLDWYSRAAFLNHENFTEMFRFAVEGMENRQDLDILDYGGGGGQFALVCKSHLPDCRVFITDISDDSLLDEWRAMNEQIPFAEFAKDERRFDLIFLNDVFEHVSHPGEVLALLRKKLKPGGRIFIDTPRQFWLYPVARSLSRGLYTKILNGTVTVYHLQIWSRRAFERVVAQSGLAALKYAERTEFTMAPEYYLDNMGIRNPVMRIAGGLLYRNADRLMRNKIMCVLTQKKDQEN